jgi:hypothetical protein
MLRGTALLIIAWLVGGCATTPPLPPECTGVLTPINGDSRAAQKEIRYEPRP